MKRDLPSMPDSESISPTEADDVEALAHAYGPRVLGAALRVLGDPSAAQDVQQSVFLRLLERPPRSVDSWPALLTTMTTRMAIDRLRRRRRFERVRLLLPTAIRPPGPPEIHADSERAGALRAALTRLAPRESEAFCLRYLSGLDVGTIARALAITENNVSVTLHRARRKLGEILNVEDTLNQEDSP